VEGAYHNRSVIPPPATPARGAGRARLERAALALALAAALALSISVLPSRIAYLERLAGARDVRERGALAADERVSPLATAGQVRWRQQLRHERPGGPARVSGLERAWTFFVDARVRIAPGARVFLARPNDLLYEFGNFLLWPARLEVATAVALPLADGEDLVRAAAARTCADREWLRASGYSACVEARGAGLALVPAGGSAP
jgi:hypothetical protein